ncbi:MAG: polymer-forming cytoskeletal protein [Gemmatimonadota bacterium]|nr:polymer-forming cytoskeletal protein [Gemmatimonadota bacterium]
MGRDRAKESQSHENTETISIVGPGMTFVGDCTTQGSIRVEGTVEGSIRAGRAVAIGPGGLVTGDVRARDATIAGSVRGTLVAEGRLELQESSRVDGDVFARTVQVGEGAVVNANVRMGEDAVARADGEQGPALELHEAASSSSSATA